MRTLTKFTSAVFIGLLTLSAGANASLILGDICSTSTVTAGGAIADACLGLYDKPAPNTTPNNSQEQATEDGLNNSSFDDPYNLAEIDGWDDTGAFGRNNWSNIEINETGGSGGTVNWSINPSLNGDYLFAIKQSTSLGLWFFEDLVGVTGGTFTDILSGNPGWSNYRVFYSEDSDCTVDCGGGPNIVVPEPSTLFLLGSTFIVLSLRKKRINNN